MEEISDKVEETKEELKKDHTARAFGVFVASTISFYLLSKFIKITTDGTEMIETLAQFDTIDTLISIGIGALMGVANYSINKTKDELNRQIKTSKVKYDKDSVLVDIIEEKSKLPELEQKKILLVEFYNTIPGNWRITDFDLERVIIHEGWNKKSVNSMVKYYAPSIVYNLKGMGRLKNYSTPYFG